MDDLGNIIYLIVIVFAGIAGIMKKVNKKQETYTGTTSDEEQDDRDIFRDIFGDDSNKPHTVVEPANQRTFSSSIGDDSKLSQEVLQTESRITQKTPKKENKKTVSTPSVTTETNQDTTSTFKFNLSDPTDARSAFLASEIFNRKY